MNKADLKKIILPDAPGVYFFLSAQKKILYIGKATSLKQRVKSYFVANLNETRSKLIENMVAEATTIEWTETDSVLEALILETNLISSHKPKFNTRSKDDKSYNHLIITNEEWPRVLVVRERDITEQFTEREILCHFGPFPSGGLLRDALKIIRKLFRYYDTKKPIGQERSKVVRGRIDFNRQIGLYPEHGDRVAYMQTIRHIKLFFQGKKATIIRDLEKTMTTLAKEQKFELANRYKKQIFALRHIEDISLLKREPGPQLSADFRIEAYDIAHLAGSNMVGVMVVVNGEAPQKSEYRMFKIKTLKGANDPAALREVLTRRLTHLEWPVPHLMVVDGNAVQKKVAEVAIAAAGLHIPVVAVVKNAQHKAERLEGEASIIQLHSHGILLANSESHRFAIQYYRRLSRQSALK